MSETRYDIFAAVTPGLEQILLDELEELGAEDGRAVTGGVLLQGSPEELWRWSLCSRVAEGLRVRAGKFEASSFDELQRGLRRVAWNVFYPRDTRPRVRARARKSRLYHTGAIEERAEATIADVLASDAAPDDRSVPTVHLRLFRDHVTVSVDATGEPLHRRGYRTHVVEAPLRETLAAACLRAAKLEPGAAFWDPFCGSGTLVLEAAAMDRGIAPGARRRFAFEDWRVHDAAAFAKVREGGCPRPPETTARPLVASDLDPTAVQAARHNASLAGLEDAVRWEEGDFAAVAQQLEQPVTVITNLPYGVRLKGGGELKELFRRFGAFLRDARSVEGAVVLNGHRDFEERSGLDWEPLLSFSNRGHSVRWLRWRR